MQKKRRSKAVRPPTFSPEVVPGVDILKWRKTPSLVASAMAITTSVQFPQMIEVIRRASPAFEVLALDASPQTSIALQRRTEGWNECLRALKSLAEPWIEAESIPETFDPQNFQTDNNP